MARRARNIDFFGENAKFSALRANIFTDFTYFSVNIAFINLKNESIATSGSYRKFKIDSISGKKYAHTIDTKTGYPSKSNLLRHPTNISNIPFHEKQQYPIWYYHFGSQRFHMHLNSWIPYGILPATLSESPQGIASAPPLND